MNFISSESSAPAIIAPMPSEASAITPSSASAVTFTATPLSLNSAVRPFSPTPSWMGSSVFPFRSTPKSNTALSPSEAAPRRAWGASRTVSPL